MAQPVALGKRDLALLGLLDLTPATAAQIRKASRTIPGEPFRDERRVRERLQALIAAGLVRRFPAAVTGGGLLHYCRLTPEGCRTLHPERESPPLRASAEVAPSG